MKKKLLLSLTILLITFSLIACSGTAATTTTAVTTAATVAATAATTATTAAATTATTAKPTTVATTTVATTAKPEVVLAVSMPSADEYCTGWMKAFKQFAEAKGYKVVSTDAQNNASKQIADVEALIAGKPKVIIMRAVDEVASVPAADAVMKAKIPLLIVDTELSSDNYDVTIESDQGVNGVLLGEYLNKWLAADPTRVAKVGYLIGKNIPDVMPRMDMLFATAPKAKKVATAIGEWNADKAMKIAEDWLHASPEINVFAAMNDEMAIGVVQALAAAGKNKKNYLILGVDGTQNGLIAVKKGEIDATVITDLEIEVKETVDVAIGLATGVKYPKKFDGSDAMQLVTKDNVAKYLK